MWTRCKELHTCTSLSSWERMLKIHRKINKCEELSGKQRERKMWQAEKRLQNAPNVLLVCFKVTACPRFNSIFAYKQVKHFTERSKAKICLQKHLKYDFFFKGTWKQSEPINCTMHIPSLHHHHYHQCGANLRSYRMCALFAHFTNWLNNFSRNTHALAVNAQLFPEPLCSFLFYQVTGWTARLVRNFSPTLDQVSLAALRAALWFLSDLWKCRTRRTEEPPHTWNTYML